MSVMFQLYEGRVQSVEKVKDGKWILVKTERAKPLGILAASYTGPMPVPGDKISVEAVELDVWFVAKHRTAVNVVHEPHFPLERLPNNRRDRNGIVIDLILGWLDTHQQVASDDIFDEAMIQVGNQMGVDGRWQIDPRFLGHAFRILSKNKVIHKVGTRKSVNHASHGRDLAVWELTRKKEAASPMASSPP